MNNNNITIKEIKSQAKRLVELAIYINLHSTEGESFERAASAGLEELKNNLAEVEAEMQETLDWWKRHDEVSEVLGRKPGEFIK